MHEIKEQNEVKKVHPMRALYAKKAKDDNPPPPVFNPSDRELRELAALEAGIGYSSDKTIALYLGAGRSTIWKWVREGILPPPKKITPHHSRWDNPKVLPILKSLGHGAGS
jgi:predicted DNA-binding transcriptional regulator AlpA